MDGKQQSSVSIRIEIEGYNHKVNIRDPRSETLYGACHKAVSQHLIHVYDTGKDEVEAMIEGEDIRILRVQDETDCYLDMSETIQNSQLVSNGILKATLSERAVAFLAQRVESTSLNQAMMISPFQISCSESTKPRSPSANSSSSSSGRRVNDYMQPGFYVRVSIDKLMFKIGVADPINDTLRKVCNKGYINYVRKVKKLRKDEASFLVESQDPNSISVEEDGAILDLDEPVLANGIQSGALLCVTIDGIPGNNDSVAQDPIPQTGTTENKFSSVDILKATGNFADENQLGRGGQAAVYKGTIFGSVVAVKKYFSGNFAEMETELRVLHKVRHPNVIPLMGSCPKERCVISEFMEGGSLQDRLKDDSGPTFKPLTWMERLRIVKEIVSALYFLHCSNVLHRDLKPANILFDSHGSVKVADMGFAKLSIEAVTTSGFRGSIGYMDPRYIQTRRAAPSSDVYSLGLIVLQLCTQKPKVQEIHSVLEKIEGGAKRSSSRGIDLFKGLLVPNDGVLPDETLTKLLKIGLECVEPSPEDRPSLASVLERLGEKSGDIISDISTKFESHEMNGEDTLEEPTGGIFEAQFELGQCFERGEGVKEDYVEALFWYHMAAKQGMETGKNAVENLCNSIFNKIKNSSNVAEHKQQFSVLYQAGMRGIPQAQNAVGYCYEHGHGVEKNNKQAAEWYSKAAVQGDPRAQSNLGVCYFHGKGVEMDMKMAVEWNEKAADQGHADAQKNLGYCYQHGYGVDVDRRKAVHWYRKAAEQEHPDALKVLGYCYQYGQGVKVDKKKAIELYLKAATQGHARAQICLGACYFNGEGVEVDKKEAAEWYRKAAEQGEARAQINLGVCYYNGDGVMQDMKKAVEWYSKAAEKGHADAQSNLAYCYHHGHGVEMDKKKAFELYAKAAVQGNEYAQCNLGYCYHLGHGVEVNKDKAMEWYFRAAARGDEIAKRNLIRMR